ncbi:MAG: hypothetical protein WC670_03470 [Pseudolabrys sp.]
MIAAAAVVTAGMAAPSFAAKKHAMPHVPTLAAIPSVPADATADAAPSYDDCFRLGWVRGVHVERGEWDDFYGQCAANHVPFASGMAVDSVERERAAHAPHS